MSIELKSIFQNGGAKLSFGRVSSAAVIAFGLALCTFGIIMEEIHPTHSIDMTTSVTQEVAENTNKVVSQTNTKLVQNRDYSSYGSFMVIGIMPLAVFLYGGGKVAQALQTKVEKPNV